MTALDRIRAALLYHSVIRPIRAAERRLSDGIWPSIARVSHWAGGVAGRLVRPWLLRDESPRGRLHALLRFSEIAEESLGIEGKNEIVDDRTARRTIQRCPFAERIRDVPRFCTEVGGCAGRGAGESLVPGSEFTIVQTMSAGAACCEYLYRVPAER